MIDLSELRTRFPQLHNLTPLCAGGQKEVCRAEHQGRPVVLKLILPIPDAGERALRELEAVRRLSSTYVPPVLETGECVLGGQKRLYIIEPFIGGTTYRDQLRRQPFQDLAFVIDLTGTLLAAAVDFERAALVHRDIKPENLMIDGTGKVWILDFGIARHLQLPSLTPSSGFGVGTIGYAAPEQYRNVKQAIDARADLFSIGIVAHESLTGGHFYLTGASDPLTVIRKMEKVDLPRLALAGDPANEFADFVACLSQRFPSRRPRSAGDALAWYEGIRNSIQSAPP